MRTMGTGMGTRTVDMITQITPMQIISKRMATYTMIILITIIQITIMLPTTMLITTIPITTIAVTIIHLSDMSIHLSALTAIPIYIFKQQ